jgi:predicted NAD-dependent protein-ADP-ribosyltransferase YbiA (DUF1768 family)
MINSLINPSVEYEETTKVLDNDIDHQANVYETEILGKKVELVLGKEREKNGLLYFVAYVVLNNGKVRPIGIFESEKDKLAIDKDGDMELDRMKGPILFKSVDLSDSLVPDESSNDESSSDDDDNAAPRGVSDGRDVIPDEHATIDSFPVATKEETEVVATGLWIQRYMQSKNYGILDNEGGGDCLFAVIRDALEQAGKSYTVGDLRKMLSENVNEEVFHNYKVLYDSFLLSVKSTKEEMGQISTENKALQEALTKEDNTRKQVNIVESAKLLKNRFYRLKDELSVSKQMIEEYKFMKGVDSLSQFKALINTCRFWGDTWAISTLERVLNTKFILLSEESFEDDDMDNVLQCGQLNDKVLEERGAFTPDYYIIMDYTGFHYKLVTYKEQRLFKFNQIPLAIKEKILDKCLEKMSGPYAIIPDFVKEKTQDEPSTEVDTSIQSVDFTPDIVFMYYSKSSGKPFPGKGAGEKIPQNTRGKFKKLAAIKDWRQKLSNQWIAPIDLDEHQWNSVEHYYQGSKYAKGHPEIYYQFTLDSRSELGKSSERAKNFNDFQEDMEFAGKYGNEVLVRGLEAKFTQHPELRELLKATHDATLTEYVPRSPARISTKLMALRKNIM